MQNWFEKIRSSLVAWIFSSAPSSTWTEIALEIYKRAATKVEQAAIRKRMELQKALSDLQNANNSLHSAQTQLGQRLKEADTKKQEFYEKTEALGGKIARLKRERQDAPNTKAKSQIEQEYFALERQLIQTEKERQITDKALKEARQNFETSGHQLKRITDQALKVAETYGITLPDSKDFETLKNKFTDELTRSAQIDAVQEATQSFFRDFKRDFQKAEGLLIDQRSKSGRPNDASGSKAA